MKGKLIALAALLGLGAVFQPYRVTTVEPGTASLVIKLFGDEETRGIENARTVTGGRLVYNKYSEQVVNVPVTQSEYQFTNKVDKYSAEAQGLNFTVKGVPFTESVVATLQWNIGDLSSYYARHKLSPEEFIQGNFYSTLNACYTQTVESFGDGGLEAVDYLSQRGAIAQEAFACVQDNFPYVTLLTLNVFDLPTYPESLAASINTRNDALQEQQTAEAERVTAEARAAANLAEAQGKADIARLEAETEAAVAAARAATVTPEYLRLLQVENERLELEIARTRAGKWNGVEPAPVNIQTPNAQIAPGAPVPTPAQ